jgi:transposase
MALTRGPYKDRQVVYERARELRVKGYGYRYIANQVDISWRTVANWVSDIPVDQKAAYKLSMESIEKKESLLTTKTALKNRLLRDSTACHRCGNLEWQGVPIPLEIHKLVAKIGYTRSNVQLLCPNCHALTDNWRGRGIGK